MDLPDSRFDAQARNIAIWSDYLKWPTKHGISKKPNCQLRYDDIGLVYIL
jgi:hypothetical protein